MQSKRISCFAILLLCLFLLSACAPKQNDTPTEAGITPVGDNADTALPVGSAGSIVSLGQDPAEPGIKSAEVDTEIIANDFPIIDGSIMTIPITEKILENILGMEHETAAKTAIHSSSVLAYERLASGQVEVLLVTNPTKEDKEIIAELDLKLNYIPIARDALVFTVNKTNELSDVSVQQLKDIYAGKTTNWKDLSKADRMITAFQQPGNSYEQGLLLDLVMTDMAPMIPPMRKITTAEKDIVADVVAAYDNGADSIGFFSYYYARASYGAAERKMLSVDGVLPNYASICGGSYGLTCNIYAVVRSDTETPENVSELIKWLVSDAGQAVMQSCGYVPLAAGQPADNTEVNP